MIFERSANEIYGSEKELIIADIFQYDNHENSKVSYLAFFSFIIKSVLSEISEISEINIDQFV